MKVIKLTEKAPTAKIKSALFGDRRGLIKTFAVLSAENPLGEKLPDEENKQRKNRLRREIEAKRKEHADGVDWHKPLMHRPTIDINDIESVMRGYGMHYVPVEGKFGNKERSFFVINISFEDAENLSRSYRQRSFFFGECECAKDENGEFAPVSATISYYQTDADENTPTEEIEYYFVEKSKRIDDRTQADDFFSKYGGLKWQFYMKYFNEDLYTDCSEELVSRCVDDKYTPKGRAYYRRTAHRGKR